MTTYHLEADVTVYEWGEDPREITLRGFSIDADSSSEAMNTLALNLAASDEVVERIRVVPPYHRRR